MNKMSFFDRQERLRSVTRRLLFLTIIGSLGVGSMGGLATALAHFKITQDAGSMVTWSELVSPFVVGASITLALTVLVVFFHLVRLYYSRTSVRRFFHARDLVEESTASESGPADRQLLNVVEEIAIASATPMPHLFLLESDHTINSFAFVQSRERATIGLTAGARDNLTRDELQAMLAHEFGHIANGDAAINIRMLALIQGFRWIYDMSVAIIGWPYRMFESFKIAFFLSVHLTLVFGAFFVVGLFGVGIARLMQAAIARQREYLADASAVQFTRFTVGLRGALDKANRYRQPRGRRPTHAAAFMMFVSPYRARSWLLRTHPTIEQRREAAEAMTPGFAENKSPA